MEGDVSYLVGQSPDIRMELIRCFNTMKQHYQELHQLFFHWVAKCATVIGNICERMPMDREDEEASGRSRVGSGVVSS